MTPASLSDEPDYRVRIVAALYGSNAPEWHQDAACASPVGEEPRSWDYTDAFWKDDISSDAELPEPLLALIGKTCAKCPVRRECLEDAYAQERHLEAIPGTVPARLQWVEDGNRSGVWGGIPGPIRERFAKSPNRLDECEAWFLKLGEERQWGKQAVVDRLWDEQAGPLRPSRRYA